MDDPQPQLAELEDVPVQEDLQMSVGFDGFQQEFYPAPNGKKLHGEKTPVDSLIVEHLKTKRYNIEQTARANIRRFFASIGIPFRLAMQLFPRR